MHLVGLVAVSLLSQLCVAADSRPPNVVLILADDLGWGDVGFNGRRDWATPNLDRLASQGTMFRRWYTAGVTCAPSRAALMTGRYPIHCGVSANNQDLPTSETTLAQAMKSRGYATGIFGKWHHGRPRPPAKTYRHPMDLGFDEFFGFTDATAAHQHFPRTLFDGRSEVPVNGYANILFTDRALDFLRRQKDKPFFLYLPYTLTHFRIEAPAEDVAPFKGKFEEKNADEPLNATYAAMVTRLDKEVGRVLAALDELRLSDNTLVIFTSDHGATFEAGNKGTSAYHKSNGPFRGQKRTLWEGGVRVPAAVRWPRQVPAGKVSDEVVHMTDIFPTVLAAVQSQPEPAWKLDGQNLIDVWRGTAKSPPRTLFWEWRAEGYNQLAAMRGNLKLVVTGNTAPELYDVVADPGEMRSLHAEHPKVMKQLQEDVKAWIGTESDASKDRGRRGQAE
jgi:arylsulfatase A-like enzyme